MDLEMTSLKNVFDDRIIEIAVILTDANLEVVAEGPDIVIHADEALFDRAPEVKRMHEESGVLAASLASTTTLEEAQFAVLGFLKQYVTEGSAPLCGNSIHMDRHFLRVHMPAVNDYLFYRCIDVSTLKELARRWAPETYLEAEKLKTRKTHRAKSDILESIEELRFYRKRFFTP